MKKLSVFFLIPQTGILTHINHQSRKLREIPYSFKTFIFCRNSCSMLFLRTRNCLAIHKRVVVVGNGHGHCVT